MQLAGLYCNHQGFREPLSIRRCPRDVHTVSYKSAIGLPEHDCANLQRNGGESLYEVAVGEVQ